MWKRDIGKEREREKTGRVIEKNSEKASDRESKNTLNDRITRSKYSLDRG